MMKENRAGDYVPRMFREEQQSRTRFNRLSLNLPKKVDRLWRVSMSLPRFAEQRIECIHVLRFTRELDNDPAFFGFSDGPPCCAGTICEKLNGRLCVDGNFMTKEFRSRSSCRNACCSTANL